MPDRRVPRQTRRHLPITDTLKRWPARTEATAQSDGEPDATGGCSGFRFLTWSQALTEQGSSTFAHPRKGRKNVRISSASASGCSIAAKCPPRGITLQRRISVYARSASERGGRRISLGNSQ